MVENLFRMVSALGGFLGGLFLFGVAFRFNVPRGTLGWAGFRRMFHVEHSGIFGRPKNL
jgi:hypothetical protein